MSKALVYRDIILNNKVELIKIHSFMDSLPRINKRLKRLLISNKVFIKYYTEYLYGLASYHSKLIFLFNREVYTKNIKIGCEIDNHILNVTLKYTGIKYDMISEALKVDRDSFIEGQHTGGTGSKFIQDDFTDGYLVSHTYKYIENTRTNIVTMGYQIRDAVVSCTKVPEKTYTFTLDDAVYEGVSAMADMSIYLSEHGTHLLDTESNQGRFYMYGKNYAIGEMIYNAVCYSENIPCLHIHLENTACGVSLKYFCNHITDEFATSLEKHIGQSGSMSELHINKSDNTVAVLYRYSHAIRRYI